MSKNTVEGRCQEFPDEFIQKGNALICKWCNKQLHCLRKDNLVEHLYSNMHQENRTAKGAKMFYDPENSPKYLQRRLLQRKTLSKKKRETRPPAALSPRNTQVEDEESLDKIFSNSDSDDTESFQGFDETALKSSPTIEAPQREGRQRKRPSHLSDSILPKNLSNINQTEEPVTSQTTPLPKKRRKSSFSAVSPTAKKSAVTKKSRKSDIRSPIRPNKKGTLKIKIRRKTDTKSKSFEVDTSESEADDEENKPEEKNTPEKSPEPVRASLKMKFFFKKTEKETEENTPTRTKSKKKKHKRKRTSTNEKQPIADDRIKQEELDQSGPVDSSFNEDIVFDEDTPAAATEEVSMKKEELSESKEENPILGEDEEDSISKADDSLVKEDVSMLEEDTSMATEEVEDGEMVEEEIVGVDDGEVVSWDEVVAEEVVADVDEVVEEEVVIEEEVAPSPDLEPELTTEQSLALKVNHARAMAKSVKASHFKKKKKTLSKKAKAKAEEKQKRKVSGYNLWSSKMRKQVATQFPGLQFGDVSKKLSDLWKRIPEKEKQMWKFRSVKMANQLERLHSTTAKRKFGSKMIETGPKKKSVLQKAMTQIDTTQQTFPPHKNPEQTMKRELAKLPAPAVEPIDAAAHFHLLGESLLTIGKKVRSSGGVASTSGALSLLLDSMVCSLAPLLTLVNQIPELNGALPDELMSDTLANIAYYMPGM